MVSRVTEALDLEANPNQESSIPVYSSGEEDQEPDLAYVENRDLDEERRRPIENTRMVGGSLKSFSTGE